MPWLASEALSIPKNVEPLLRHPEKVLSKFNLDEKEPAEDHARKFMLAIRLLNVEHEDVVCRLFPFTFEAKASTWYISETLGSIHSWDDFQTFLIGKFGDDKSPAKLLLELSKIKIDLKEKVKHFSQ